MTDAITRIGDDSRTYWQEADTLRHVAEDISSEIESPIHETEAPGRAAHAVVGDDVARFEVEWVIEHRSDPDRPPST